MRTQGWQLTVAIGLGMSGAIGLPFMTLAQTAPSNIVEDATVGTTVIRNFFGSPIEAIRGGAERGQNLFHSFQEFNISPNRAALFLIPNSTIQNVFARVTGRNLSQIDGVLSTLLDGSFTTSTANLFLINPNGIIFGAGSSLNVGGSFVATTANAIQFGDRGLFSASVPNVPSPLLTINPSAFLFNQINPAPIQSSSRNLYVGDGRSLLLLGGDVTLDNGFLGVATDIGGRAELGGLAAPGKVDLAIDGGLFRLSFPNDVLRGDVTLKNGSIVNVVAGSGGSLAIHAQNLTVSGGSSLLAGINSGLGSPNGQAGDITLDATRILVDQSSFIKNVVNANAVGNGGNIFIQAKQLEVSGNSSIEASTAGAGRSGDITIETSSLRVQNSNISSGTILGQGRAGNLTIHAADSIDLMNNGNLGSLSIGTGDGNATGSGGNISLTTGNLTVMNSGIFAVTFLGQGNAGNLTIQATNAVNITGGVLSTSSLGAGTGGDLFINTRNLKVEGGGGLTTSTFDLRAIDSNALDPRIFTQPSIDLIKSLISTISPENVGKANSGNLTIIATDSVKLSGTSANGQSSSYLATQTLGAGNAGNLTITTGRLAVQDSAFISSGAGSGSQGKGGNLTINASGSVELHGVPALGQNFSRLVTQTEGAGNAGDLTITTGRLVIQDGTFVSSAARLDSQGKGGNLIINASNSVELIGNSSNGLSISGLATQTQGTGDAGDLTINTDRLLVRDGAFVSSGTLSSSQGKGGNLTVNASNSVELVGGLANGQRFSNLATQTEGTGDAGDLTINTERLLVRDGAFVSSGTLSRRGKGGDLTINASGSIELSAVPGSQFLGGLTTQTTGVGDAGDLRINAEKLLVRDRGEISAASFNQGNGGKIYIQTGSLTLENGASISSISRQQGKAGSIDIIIRDSLQANNSSISTNSTQVGGGNIDIAARNIFLRGNSDITTNVFSGAGNGGSITLSAEAIIALNDSDILAFAQQGKGGNITLATRAFFGQNYRPGSPAPWDGNGRVDINASGTVSGIITLPDVSFLQNGLTDFPQTFTDTTQLLANSCIVRSRKQNGKFFITGSGGLPVRPGDAPLSPFPTGEVGSVRGEERGVRGEEGQGRQGEQRGGRDEGRGMRDEGREESYVIQNPPLGVQQVPDRPWKIGDPIVEPQGVYRLANGDLVMSRECP